MNIFFFKLRNAARVNYDVSVSGNSQRRTPTCRWTWRRRATRRSGWVALTRSCCGVFRQASWAPVWLPPPHPSIDPPLDRAPPPAHTRTINDTVNGSSCIFLSFGIGSPVFFFFLTLKLTLRGRILLYVETQIRLFLRRCDAFPKSNPRNFHLWPKELY